MSVPTAIDYTVDVLGGATGANYTTNYKNSKTHDADHASSVRI